MFALCHWHKAVSYRVVTWPYNARMRDRLNFRRPASMRVPRRKCFLRAVPMWAVRRFQDLGITRDNAGLENTRFDIDIPYKTAVSVFLSLTEVLRCRLAPVGRCGRWAYGKSCMLLWKSLTMIQPFILSGR